MKICKGNVFVPKSSVIGDVQIPIYKIKLFKKLTKIFPNSLWEIRIQSANGKWIKPMNYMIFTGQIEKYYNEA